MKWSLVFLLVFSAVLNAATTVSVYWLDEKNNVMTFVDGSKGYYSLKLCVVSSSDVSVHLTLRGDAFGAPKYYEAILKTQRGKACKDVLLYFGERPSTTERSYDVVINANNVNGIYADVEVNGVKLERLGYLRVLRLGGSELTRCLKVNSNVTYPFIGEHVKLAVSNSCGTPLDVTVKVDVENFADFDLASFVLASNEKREINVTVPKLVAVNLLGPLGGPAVAVRGLYVSINGTALYYVPVYDYFTYYVKQNVKSEWRSGGRALKAVGPGEVVTGCASLPEVVPRTEVPPLEASLKVVEDLSFAPDEVVAKKNFVIDKLPFKECVSFVTEKRWNTKGYKLVLEVSEDVEVMRGKVPLRVSVELSPELAVR
ncbi:hypothetical protein [Ignicoccus hospitalis]|uniref:hypothetical protein n=1 Tax=Ignicoccus hospitalis TaxID=160233 RepID=UPI000697D7FB|nr:hypothetical protein [Ignicoccus hospitalis]HIH90759.1 hypothetical protein [Desulfurococcaceae archaeon]